MARPESQGVDTEALLDLLDHLEKTDPGIHSLVLVRHGVLILDVAFYPYDGTVPHDVASVTKSITSSLLGIAIRDRVIKTLDQSVIDILGIEPSAIDDPIKANITLRDLVSMRSGFDCGIKPGEPELISMMTSSDWIEYTLDLPLLTSPNQRFAYCSPGMHLLSAVITTTTDETLADYAQLKLFDQLGINPGDWPTDPSGYTHGWGDLRLLPQDMAKIGLLLLHDGVWSGQRILPEDWVKTATNSRGPSGAGADGYGLGWWISSGDLVGAFEARGRGGQRIVVVPPLDLIVVTTGAGFDPVVLLPFLNRALVQEAPLPENDVATGRLHRAVANETHLRNADTRSERGFPGIGQTVSLCDQSAWFPDYQV